MDYRYLDAFREAARFESFIQAAKTLGIAASALTRQIQLFEASVKQDCFIRSGRAVKLTPFGAVLYRKVLDFERISGDASTSHGSLMIGCLQSVFEGVLAEFLTKHRERFGHQIMVDVGSPSHIQGLMEKGKIDVSLNTLTVKTNGFTSVKVFAETLVLVSKKKEWVKAPLDTNWIIYTPLEQVWTNSRIFKGHTSNHVIRTNSLNAAIELAALGSGIAILPDGANLKRRGLHLENLPKHPSENIFLTHPAYKQMPDNINEFVSRLLEFPPCKR